MPPAAVVIPIRAFARGKARLASELDDDTRAALFARMADAVLAAAGELPVAVVTSADEVRAWAASHPLAPAVLDDPGTLDGAAATGTSWAATRGVGRVVVAHADLPRARDLTPLARDADRPILAIVPAHRDGGSPVVSVPTAPAFPFAYGPGSFRRHVRAARRLGLGTRVVRDPDLAFDVDTPDDLRALAALTATQ